MQEFLAVIEEVKIHNYPGEGDPRNLFSARKVVLGKVIRRDEWTTEKSVSPTQVI